MSNEIELCKPTLETSCHLHSLNVVKVVARSIEQIVTLLHLSGAISNFQMTTFSLIGPLGVNLAPNFSCAYSSWTLYYAYWPSWKSFLEFLEITGSPLGTVQILESCNVF